jgi:glycosyltransferase involved in cell wall biosynthesis
MKIAIVANSTWNIYNFRLNILRALEEKGAEIVVIAPIDKYIFYLNEFKNVRHIPLKRLSRKSKNPLRDLLLFNEFYNIYKREKFDVVLHYTIKPNIWGNLAARFCQTPSVCAVTGLGYAFLHNGWVEKLTTLLYRFSFKSAKKVIFENDEDRVYFDEKNITKLGQSMSVNGCGIDTDYYAIEKVTTSKMPNKNKVVFTFIGRFLYDKGIVEFVEAAKNIKEKYKNVEFWLVGEIDENYPATISTDQLLSWVNQRAVIDKGPSSDVRAEIATSDCIILPSYREGTSRVLLEAASMGKPIITTDVPGCRNVVENNVNGILCQAGSSSSLTDAIACFLSLSDEQCAEMGKLGRNKAVNIFGANQIVAAYLKLFNEIIDEKN